MKLELKHLAHYLPYKMSVYDYNAYPVCGLFTMNHNGGTGNISISEILYSPKIYKPALRSLYSMTEDDVKDFFIQAYMDVYNNRPLPEAIYSYHGWDGNQFGLTMQEGDYIYGFSIDFESEKDFRLSYRLVGSTDNNSTLRIDKLQLFEKMFERNFDVYELIEQGLAIDKALLT